MTNTRASSKIIKNRGMEYTHGLAETFTKETTRITCEVDMARCTARMEAFIEVFGSWTNKTEKESSSMEAED